jgi:hypothetical protein
MTRYKKGQKLPHEAANRFEENYDWYRRFKAFGEGGGSSSTPVNFSTVMAANYTGQQINIGDVCEFAGNPFPDPDPSLYLPDPRDGRWLKAVTPDASPETARSGFGVALDSIGDGTGDDREGGAFLCVGICHAKVQIVDSNHDHAILDSGERTFKSSNEGPVKILHKPTGGSLPEQRLCLVQLMDETGDIVDTLQVYHEDKDPGEIVEANESNVHPGRIRRFNEEDGMEILEDVWIGFTDRFDQWQGAVLAVQEEFYGPGRRNGSFTVGESEEADARPLYLVTHGEKTWDAFAYDEIVAGETHLVEFLEWDDGEMKFMPTGIRWEAQDFYLNADETQDAGTKVMVKWRGPRLIITGMYCKKSDDTDIEAALPSEE